MAKVHISAGSIVDFYHGVRPKDEPLGDMAWYLAGLLKGHLRVGK
jgi:hypothetical protein